MDNLKIALLPMEIAWERKDINLSYLSGIIDKLPINTDLLVLPETFSTGFPTGETREYLITHAESIDGSTINFLKNLAHEKNVAICGSLVIREDENLFNRGFFIEPGGETTFADKKHLFTMAGEKEIFSQGNKRLLVRYRGWNISMIICYDIRFPVWCRNVDNTYDLLIAVANWPEVRIKAWERLLTARAIENCAFVCGVDCRGTDKKGFIYNGSSAIIDFKGDNIGSETDSPFITATLEKERLLKFREKFPAWKDADRFELLKA